MSVDLLKVAKDPLGKTFKTACYLVNRSPGITISYKTLLESWSGWVANYSKLKSIGYEVYAHVKQRKLEPRALKSKFLGYPDDVKYICYGVLISKHHNV